MSWVRPQYISGLVDGNLPPFLIPASVFIVGGYYLIFNGLIMGHLRDIVPDYHPSGGAI